MKTTLGMLGVVFNIAALYVVSLPIIASPNITVSVDNLPISLSGSTKAFVDAGLADGSYASVAECIDDLLLAGIKAKAQEKLEALLLEGLESGDGQPWTDKDWDELRSRIINR